MRTTAAIRAIAFTAMMLLSSVLVLTAPARADAWTKLDMGIPYSGTVSRGLCKVAVGDGDNDNATEVYFSGWDDGHVYRFNYSDGNWNYRDLGKLVVANDVRARGMLVGDGDDDGLNEVYVSGVYRDWFWQPWNNHLWRFSWNGATWDKTDMGASGATSRDIALGDGNNDGRQEIYSADATGHVYEYSKGNEWNVQDIGSVPKFYDANTSAWVTPAVRGVSVGDADNDGFNEVYAATSDHHVYRYSYDNASATWDLGDVGTGVDDGTSDNYYQGFTKVVVGDADNDGLMEAYASSYINATVYMFKWNSTSAAWERTSLVSLGVKENAHDLCIGDGNSDGLNEIYAGTSNKQVYEVYYNGTSGQWESLAVGSGNAAMNGVAIGAPRGDARTQEVFGASGDGHGYEFFDDRVAPANPSVWSDTHPVPGTWYDKNVVHMLWKDAGPDISGIDGYSVSWDNSSDTVPPDNKTCEENVQDATSPALADGSGWYFHIRARDNALNWNGSATGFGPILIDTTAPDLLKLTINNDDAYVNSDAVTLSVTATDPSPGSGIAKMAFSNDGSTWSPWEGFAASRSGWSLTDARYGGTDTDGTKTVYARVMDAVGHEIAADKRGSDSIFLDRAEPGNLSVTINGGAAYSTSADISLGLSAQDPDPASGLWRMQFSNDGMSWSEWLGWSVQWNWSLTTGAGGSDADGNRTVSVKVEDRAGNIGGPTTASVFLDRRAPGNLSFTMDGGAGYTNTSAVDLAIQAADPQPGSAVADMTLANDEPSLGTWEVFATTKTGWDLTSGNGGTDTDGNKTVFLEVRDRAGNVAGPVGDTIFLDRVRPGALSILINGGASYTTNRDVVLTLSATDPEPASGVLVMQLSDDGVGWTPLEAYSVQSNYTLPGQDGLKTVFFRVWDRAGNAADPVNASIILDTASPSISNVRASGVTDKSAVITWTTDEVADSAIDYGLTADYGSSKLDPAFLTSHSLALGNLTPGTTYHFKVHSTDRAGNAPAYSGDYVFITTATPDTAPPVISNVQVSGITNTLAVVSWTTNEPADSSVQYGTDIGYGQASSDGNFVIVHSLVLKGLLAGTTYHFMALSTDPSANGPSKSADRSFTTLATPDVAPPVISNVKVSGITDTLAVVSWETDEPSDGTVEFGVTTAYGRTAGHSGLLTLHELTLTGLAANATYHFRVGSTDASGNGPAMSPDISFTTSSTPDTAPPAIFNVRVEGVSGSGATVLWETDEIADGLVEYGASTAYGLTSANPAYSVQHSAALEGLAPKTTYHFRVRSTDPSGNAGTSVDANFKTPGKGTARDTTPPVISGIEITGITDTRAVVLWLTDELADSEVDYGAAASYGLRSSDPAFAVVHSLVLSGLAPSTTYHAGVRSTDVSGNGPALGPDLTFATGATPDLVPPTITDLKVSGITNTSATISWRTDEPSDGIVDYGLGLSYGHTLASQAYILNHSIVISGLTPGTTYHFRVSSVDPSANPSGPSMDMTFTTLTTYVPPGSGPAPKPGALTVAGIPWLWLALGIIIVAAAAAGVGVWARRRRKAPLQHSASAGHGPTDVKGETVETLEMSPAAVPAEPAFGPASAFSDGVSPDASAINERVSPEGEPVEVLPMEPAQGPLAPASPPVKAHAPIAARTPSLVPARAPPSAAARAPAAAPGPRTPVKHIRCPGCKTRLPIYNDVPQEIVCPNCGRRGPYKPKGGTSTASAQAAQTEHGPKPLSRTSPMPQLTKTAASEAGPRTIRCSGCGSRVTIHGTSFPLRVTCPNCGKSGMYRGPKNG